MLIMPILQFGQQRARDGYISSHALTSTVRLTVETNIMTSKSLLGLDTSIITLFSLSYRQYCGVDSGCPLPSEWFFLARKHLPCQY